MAWHDAEDAVCDVLHLDQGDKEEISLVLVRFDQRVAAFAHVSRPLELGSSSEERIDSNGCQVNDTVKHGGESCLQTRYMVVAEEGSLLGMGMCCLQIVSTSGFFLVQCCPRIADQGSWSDSDEPGRPIQLEVDDESHGELNQICRLHLNIEMKVIPMQSCQSRIDSKGRFLAYHPR